MNTRIIVLGLGSSLFLGACSNWPHWERRQPMASEQLSMTTPKPSPTPRKSEAAPKTPEKKSVSKKPTTVGEAPRTEKTREPQQRTTSSTTTATPAEARRSSVPAQPQRNPPKEERVTNAAPTPAPQARRDTEYPFASPVPGKPGFVTSPYAPYAGQVDVQGFSPGSEARDPYTGKIFRVP